MLDLGIVFSIFSSAKIGPPAATSPIIGMSSLVVSFKIIPLDAPERILMKPFFSIARKCCSAALGDLKPRDFAISALVGGNPKS